MIRTQGWTEWWQEWPLNEVKKGVETEMEHTDDDSIASKRQNTNNNVMECNVMLVDT